MRTKLLALSAVAILSLAGAADAAVVHFMATLNGASETPPNDSAGTGMAMATLDTDSKAFTYEVTYKGLTGPAIAAHFHGPAGPGAAAPPTVPMTGDLASPIKGSATLTDTQVKELMAGQWYVNVHTAAHKGGEIRGQVLRTN